MAFETFEVDRGKRLLRALVAEDDPGIRRLIVGLLEMDGWEVREAADGDEAVAIASDWQPDTVVIDVMMPNKDGLTAVREIRAMAGGSGVGVVVVSGRTSEQARADARDAGSDEFVSKPFHPDELTARARAAIRWKSTEPAAATDTPPGHP